MSDIIALENEKLPFDFELFHRCNLFTPEEIRNISKSRNEHDYKISNSSLRNARSFLEYISYERGLLLQVNERRRASENQEPKASDAKMLVEQIIITKIVKLYKETLGLYKDEERIFENFFKFCKISKHISEVPLYILKYLEIHGAKQDTWITAAKFEYEELKNPTSSRLTFTKALARHPKSKEIYKAFLKTELMEASALNKQLETTNSDSKQPIAVKRILDIYNHSKKYIFDIQFMVELLELFENYNFAYTLQSTVVRDIMDLFPADEQTWNTLAQRELKGYPVNDVFNDSVDLVPASPPSINASVTPESGLLTPKIDMDAPVTCVPKLTLKKRIELCTKIYYRAAHCIKTPKMWTFYINAMLDLNKDTSTQAKLKFKCLLIAFKAAHDESFLSEKQYVQYIECLKRSDNPDESEHLLLAVLEKATTNFPKSIDLWSSFLNYFILYNNELKLQEKFYIAVKKCGRESLPLWNLYKQHLLITTSAEDKNKVDGLFMKAIYQPEPISSHFKVDYLEWLVVTKGVSKVRAVFNDLSIKSPCYEMNKKMILINTQLIMHKNIEEPSLDADVLAIRELYKSTIEKYGKTKCDIWIDYIKFEQELGDSKHMTYIVALAKQQIDPKYLDAFMSQYELLKLI